MAFRHCGLRARHEITRSSSRPMHLGWLRCSSVTYREVCSLLAPRHPGASAAISDSTYSEPGPQGPARNNSLILPADASRLVRARVCRRGAGSRRTDAKALIAVVVATLGLIAAPAVAKKKDAASRQALAIHLRGVDLVHRLILIEVDGMAKAPPSNYFTMTDDRGHHYVAQTIHCDPPFPFGHAHLRARDPRRLRAPSAGGARAASRRASRQAARGSTPMRSRRPGSPPNRRTRRQRANLRRARRQRQRTAACLTGSVRRPMLER